MTYQEQIVKELERIREGWCSPEKATAIAETIIRERTETFIEIGVFAGKSLIAAAIGMNQLGVGSAYGIDSWQASDSTIDVEPENAAWWSNNVNLMDIYSQCLRNVHESGLAKYIRILMMTSAEASKIIRSPVDFLHIDGSHSEWSSTSDVCLWMPKVKKGGIVLMDDSDWPSTQTAVRFTLKWCDQLETIAGKESTCTFFRKR